jgi:structure-specific recognition protein 1
MEDYVPPPKDDDDEDDDDDDEDDNGGKKKGKGKGGAAASKKKKVKKDPNAPKRPMAAYFLWMGDVRESVKRENPEATIGELGKIMGAKWKTLSK